MDKLYLQQCTHRPSPTPVISQIHSSRVDQQPILPLAHKWKISPCSPFRSLCLCVSLFLSLMFCLAKYRQQQCVCVVGWPRHIHPPLLALHTECQRPAIPQGHSVGDQERLRAQCHMQGNPYTKTVRTHFVWHKKRSGTTSCKTTINSEYLQVLVYINVTTSPHGSNVRRINPVKHHTRVYSCDYIRHGFCVVKYFTCFTSLNSACVYITFL